MAHEKEEREREKHDRQLCMTVIGLMLRSGVSFRLRTTRAVSCEAQCFLHGESPPHTYMYKLCEHKLAFDHNHVLLLLLFAFVRRALRMRTWFSYAINLKLEICDFRVVFQYISLFTPGGLPPQILHDAVHADPACAPAHAADSAACVAPDAAATTAANAAAAASDANDADAAPAAVSAAAAAAAAVSATAAAAAAAAT
jgi:hypothetical protein